MLSACFVLPIEDSLEGILQTHRDAALIEAAGGGIGYSFSNIRMKGAPISGTQGKACGPVAVMDHLGSLGKMVTQGFREGAHMGQLSAEHPDIFDFIHYKDNQDRISNFNISVQLTDEFMEAKNQSGSWQDRVWRDLCKSAWRTGDPGVVFIDRVWNTQPVDTYGLIQSSNPCGEEFLEPYGNCCLGSINLANFISAEDEEYIEWKRLAKVIRLAVRFLNDVIEVNKFPIERLREVNLATRRIGLGVMGWADVLATLKIPYGSVESLKYAELIAKFMSDIATLESERLANIHGAFELYRGFEIGRVPRKLPSDEKCFSNYYCADRYHLAYRRVLTRDRTTLCPRMDA